MGWEVVVMRTPTMPIMGIDGLGVGALVTLAGVDWRFKGIAIANSALEFSG